MFTNKINKITIAKTHYFKHPVFKTLYTHILKNSTETSTSYPVLFNLQAMRYICIYNLPYRFRISYVQIILLLILILFNNTYYYNVHVLNVKRPFGNKLEYIELLTPYTESRKLNILYDNRVGVILIR